jgi:hypothetical protein
LLLSQAPVFAIGLSILGFDVPAEIGTVNLYGSRQLRFVRIMNLRAHRLAQLVQQYESALRVDVEITADL